MEEKGVCGEREAGAGKGGKRKGNKTQIRKDKETREGKEKGHDLTAGVREEVKRGKGCGHRRRRKRR